MPRQVFLGMNMAEPASAGSYGIAALAIALLGPLAGEYAIIVMAALAGALWPLSTMTISSRKAGAFFLFRIVLTAVFLTGSAAWYLESNYSVPAVHGMAIVAFFIGALGNGWSPVLSAIRDGLAAIAGRLAGGRQ